MEEDLGIPREYWGGRPGNTARILGRKSWEYRANTGEEDQGILARKTWEYWRGRPGNTKGILGRKTWGILGRKTREYWGGRPGNTVGILGRKSWEYWGGRTGNTGEEDLGILGRKTWEYHRNSGEEDLGIPQEYWGGRSGNTAGILRRKTWGILGRKNWEYWGGKPGNTTGIRGEDTGTKHDVDQEIVREHCGRDQDRPRRRVEIPVSIPIPDGAAETRAAFGIP